MVSETFAKDARLTRSAEYTNVLQERCRVSGEHLQFYARPNPGSTPRLGIIISKKIAARAVDRNYVKRVVRELFRRSSEQFSGLDVVVRARKPLPRGSYFAIRQEFSALAAGLDKCRAR